MRRNCRCPIARRKRAIAAMCITATGVTERSAAQSTAEGGASWTAFCSARKKTAGTRRRQRLLDQRKAKASGSFCRSEARPIAANATRLQCLGRARHPLPGQLMRPLSKSFTTMSRQRDAAVEFSLYSMVLVEVECILLWSTHWMPGGRRDESVSPQR